MSSILTPEVFASAARALGWPPSVRIWRSDLPTLISGLRLDLLWVDGYLCVKRDGGPGHIERIGHDTLFVAVVMCAALIGDAQ